MTTERRELGERRIKVFGPDGPEDCTVRWWRERDTYGVALECPFGQFEAQAADAFEALLQIRQQIEPMGRLVGVQGSRLDAYPSGMAREMGGGLRIYQLRPGGQAYRTDLVDTFDDAEFEDLATVEAQRAYFETWMRSLDE